MALGLSTAINQKDYWTRNVRRRVARDYPEGTAPLTALLSLMEPGAETPTPEFGWPEERYTSIKTKTSTTGQPTSGVVFYNAGTTTTAGTPVTVSTSQNLRVYVDSVADFQVDDGIHIYQVALTSGSDNLVGRVIGKSPVGAAAPYLEFVPVNVPVGVTATVLNSSDANEGKFVFLAGSMYLEGSRSRTGRTSLPLDVKNHVQLQKNAFGCSSYALKAPTVYNKSGVYQDLLRLNGMHHLDGLERTTLFGHRGINAITENDPDSGDPMARYTTGGLMWYLQQWEKGGVGGGIAYPHEGGTTDVSTIARTDWESYIDKRIIQLDSATITRAQFNRLTARPFEKVNSKSRDKLVLCGPDYLTKVQEMFEKNVTWTSLRDSGVTGWDFQLLQHMGPFGTVYYKVHPLFQNIVHRSSAMYIDLGWLKWRPFADHDTQIVTGIQPKDALIRKDMYFTSGGIEVGFPEAHMWVENLGGITL